MKLNHGLISSLLSCIIVLAGVTASAQQTSPKPVSKQMSGKQSPPNSKEVEIARGRYLVEEVARCPDCHTPRDSTGAVDRSRWLQGAPIWIMPVKSKQDWAMSAPSLINFSYSDEQAFGILEKGLGTNGIPIQRPMHIYHLHHEDAVAIIAYLRSLSRPK